MKQIKDPFEAAYEEQQQEEDESPPESPIGDSLLHSQTPPLPVSTTSQEHHHHHHPVVHIVADEDDDYDDYDDQFGTTSSAATAADGVHSSVNTDPSSSAAAAANASTAPMLSGSRINKAKNNNKEDDDDEEEENVDVELSKFPSSSDSVKMTKMKAILSQFSEGQMTRYESFRRSALQKANMRRLLVSITGNQKISLPMTIVVCGIAKMFVGELVETARIVMTERMDTGPIRPCHIREAFRRLKLEGKLPKRSVPRLFR
ncbi:transcription initiation factor TFIID subunit 11 [Mercurialis annua]|uniref:transcription initiation factor TFIID subunit 11 n=1 Tax=Mercurialis annua TaxID=3986 RepID=UPI00215F510A|nr:transcription initiation factor TFIID subunit 11 [Mercurialis annua]